MEQTTVGTPETQHNERATLATKYTAHFGNGHFTTGLSPKNRNGTEEFVLNACTFLKPTAA